MDTFDAIKTRRAIKKFDSSYKMTPEQVKSLMELAILSPTSYNQQNWRFVTVTDQAVKEKIHVAARNQAQPLDGSLVKVTPVAHLSPIFPKTIDCTFTAVPQSDGI